MAGIDLGLSGGMRNTLLTLQSLQAKISTSQERLASGQRVNAMVDAPAIFFAAKNLNNRANDLMSLKDAMGQAISTVKAGSKGADTIQNLLAQARGLTTAAMGAMGTDAASIATRKSLAEQFDHILDAIDGVVDDSGYKGKNLIKGDGKRIDATPESKLNVLKIPGVTDARVSNTKENDAYQIDILGTGAITGNSKDIADAEQAHGIQPIAITGAQSNTQGNFNSINFEVNGPPGRDKQITVGNPPEATTVKFTQEQWHTANKTNTPLTFEHTFSSGTHVSFNVDFDLIEAAEPNHGQGTSKVEKMVDLQLRIRNDQNLEIVRDAAAAIGTGKLSNGENAFEFPSGTVRLSIDEKTLMPQPSEKLPPVALPPPSPPPLPPPPPPPNLSWSGTIRSGNGSYNAGSASWAWTDFLAQGGIDYAGTTTLSFTANNVPANFRLSIIDNANASVIGSPVSIGPMIGNNTISIHNSASPNTYIRADVDIGVPGPNLADWAFTLTYTPDPLPPSPPPPLPPSPSAPSTPLASYGSHGLLQTVQTAAPNTENHLTVAFDSTETDKFTVGAVNLKADGQGLQVDCSQNEWRDTGDIENAISGLDTAEQRLRSASQALTNGLDIITTRETFTKEFSDVLSEGAAKLTLLDQNEEGSNLLMLQTRQQLSMTALTLAAKSQQSILNLF